MGILTVSGCFSQILEKAATSFVGVDIPVVMGEFRADVHRVADGGGVKLSTNIFFLCKVTMDCF